MIVQGEILTGYLERPPGFKAVQADMGWKCPASLLTSKEYGFITLSVISILELPSQKEVKEADTSMLRQLNKQ